MLEKFVFNSDDNFLKPSLTWTYLPKNRILIKLNELNMEQPCREVKVVEDK